MKRPMTEPELIIMCQLYLDGKTCGEIGSHLGRSTDTISRNLKKRGVALRTYRDYYAETVDEGYFAIIDREDKAYWLGFTAADGCISESAGDLRAFHLVLQRGDRSHLEAFKAAISYSGRVRDFTQYTKNRNKSYLKSGIDFNNRKFCLHLLEKGWVEFKKEDNPDLLLHHIPLRLMSHFVRGFFDGDGCISRNKKRFKSHYFNFAGSPRVLSAVCEPVVMELGFVRKQPKPSKRHKAYRLGWNGNTQVSQFGNWIYRDATTWLQRKRDRFQAIHDHRLPELRFDEGNRFVYPLSVREILAAPEPYRERLVTQFRRAIAVRPWVSPQYSEIELLEDWERVKEETTGDYICEGGFRSRRISYKEFAGRKLLVHHQPHYWNTRYRSQKTLVEGWSDPKIRDRAIHNLFHTPGARLTLARYLRELNFAGARRVSHFHPGLVKSIIQTYAPETSTWLDPCAGWGARLLGAAAIGLEYTGCDPNHLSMPGCERIAKFVGFECSLYCLPFERFKTSDRYDLVFTSPPYFNTELYEHGEQSYKGRATYQQWYDEFMLPMANRCLEFAPIVLFHVSERIKNSLLIDFQNSQSTPVYMQKTVGGPRAAEWIILVRK